MYGVLKGLGSIGFTGTLTFYVSLDIVVPILGVRFIHVKWYSLVHRFVSASGFSHVS